MADQEFRKFVGTNVCVYAWMDTQTVRTLCVYQQGHYFNSLYLDCNLHYAHHFIPLPLVMSTMRLCHTVSRGLVS